MFLSFISETASWYTYEILAESWAVETPFKSKSGKQKHSAYDPQ